MAVSSAETGSHAEVNGLLLSGGAQRSDMRTTVHHIAQGCSAQQSQKNMVVSFASNQIQCGCSAF